MFRKVLISAVIATAVFAAGSAVYAQTGYSDARSDEVPAFKLISDKSELRTWESEYIVSGNAMEGTTITMNLYWFNTSDGKGIMAKKKASVTESENEGDWLLQETEEWTVGSSGIIAKPVTLYFGRNKIVLDITDVDGNEAQKILEIELTTKAEANEVVNGDSMKRLLDDITNEANIEQ